MAKFNLKGKIKIPVVGSVPTIYVVGVVGTVGAVAALYIINDQLGLGIPLPSIDDLGAEEQIETGPAEVVVFTTNPAHVYQGGRMVVSGSFLDASGAPATVDEGFYTILEDGREIRATGSLGHSISSFNVDVPIPHSFRDGVYDIYVTDHPLNATDLAEKVRLPVNQPMINLPNTPQRLVGVTPPQPSLYNPAGTIGVH